MNTLTKIITGENNMAITKDKISVVASSFGTCCDPYIGSLKNTQKMLLI